MLSNDDYDDLQNYFAINENKFKKSCYI